MAIRIIIADDHGIIRDGLAALLREHSEFCVVGTATNGREAVRLASTLKPDIAILDVSMPDMNGIESAHGIKAASSTTRVLALSMHAERQFVSLMLEAGARGYLLKDCVCDELVEAIHSVMQNQLYFSSKLSSAVVDTVVHPSPRGAHALSARERQTLQLIAEGWRTKQIALELGVSQKTIEKFRQRLMEKIGVTSIAELTKYALREGVTSI